MPGKAGVNAQPGISVIVPAYNEEARLSPTLEEALAYLRERCAPFELIVVDDGSRDRTSEIVAALGDEAPELRLVRLAANRGKGYAVRSGVVNSRGRRVLFMDADGATPMTELEKLQEALEAGADVAIGSRALPGEGAEVRARLHRKVIGRTFHLLVSLLTVKGFRDTQCGFKLFRGEVAHDLFSRMRMNGFSFDVEVLMMARQQGYRVDEVPVSWTHQPGSRVNLMTDSLRMLLDLFVIRARALRGDYREPHVARMGNWVEPGAGHRTQAVS